jgi:hypothetical protein
MAAAGSAPRKCLRPRTCALKAQAAITIKLWLRPANPLQFRAPLSIEKWCRPVSNDLNAVRAHCRRMLE